MNTESITTITDTDEIATRTHLAALSEPADRALGAIINAYGTSQALAMILDASFTAADATAVTGASITQADLARLRSRTPINVDDTIARMRKTGAVMIDPLTVPGIADLGDYAPVALWVRGDVNALTATPALAITGARAATGYGEFVTADFVTRLAKHNVTIHSGAAYGIDGTAHRAALMAGTGTVAWLAGGIDRPYPAGHSELVDQIARTHGCAVLSEVPLGTAPTRWRFLQRNRLLAAATAATLIVEAGWRSGALATAKQAQALDRHVAAIPGSITSPASHGAHRLIQEGIATITTTTADLYPHLNIPTP